MSRFKCIGEPWLHISGRCGKRQSCQVVQLGFVLTMLPQFLDVIAVMNDGERLCR